MAAFRGMHMSPAKQLCLTTKKAWLPDRQTDRDRQTDAGQSDPYVPLCFAGNTKIIISYSHSYSTNDEDHAASIIYIRYLVMIVHGILKLAVSVHRHQPHRAPLHEQRPHTGILKYWLWGSAAIIFPVDNNKMFVSKIYWPFTGYKFKRNDVKQLFIMMSYFVMENICIILVLSHLTMPKWYIYYSKKV